MKDTASPHNSPRLAELGAICTANNLAIACDWKKPNGLLRNKLQQPNGGCAPAVPLIMARWQHTLSHVQVLPFKEPILWACVRGPLDEMGGAMRGMSEEASYHSCQP